MMKIYKLAKELNVSLAVGTNEDKLLVPNKVALLKAYIKRDAKLFSRLLTEIPNIPSWLIANGKVSTEYKGTPSDRVISLLNGRNLSSSQLADIEATTGGTYTPPCNKLFNEEITKLVLEDNTTELIKLYKRLPQPKQANNDLADYLSLPHSDLLSKVNIADAHTLVDTPLADRDWRLDNLYHIIDKNGENLIMHPNPAQLALRDALAEHPRVLVLKSRQRGLTTYSAIRALDECISKPNITRGLLTADLKSANAVMKKLKHAYKEMPESMLPNITYSNNSELTFSNGSTVRIATSFRGDTIHSLHISELGKISQDYEKSQELKSGTLQALPSVASTEVVGESTSEGPNNLFSSMYASAKEGYIAGNYKTYLPLFIGWAGVFNKGVLMPNTEDTDCTLPVDMGTVIPDVLSDWLMDFQAKYSYEFTDKQIEWAVATYIELGSDITEIKREYPLEEVDAWSSSNSGLIYHEAMENVEYGDYVVNKAHPIYAAADIGVGDRTCILFAQYINHRLYIFHEFYGSGKPISYYIREVQRMNVDLLYLPHDANNRSIATAQKVVTHIRLAGFDKYKVLKQTRDRWVDISRVRSFLYKCTFSKGLESVKQLKSYRKKWSPQTGNFLDEPLHDEASDYADALRYLIIGTLTHILKEYK